MAGNEEDHEETHKAWHNAAKGNLREAKSAKSSVKEKLLELEKKHQDKVDAIAAERRRQERLAAEAAARAKREQEERARAAFKRQQAADLKAKQDALAARRRGEANALKEATANFKKAREEEDRASLKGKRLFDLGKSQSELQNAFIACFKQYRSWFVAVKACEMRLEEREKRPEQERIPDNVHHALEKELNTLNEARTFLKGLVDEGERLSSEMSHTRHMLVTANSRDNVGFRRQQEVERTMPRASSTPSLPAIDGTSPKNEPTSSRHEFTKTVNKMFEHDHPSQDELLDTARTLFTRANALTVECQQVLQNCRNNVNKVMAASNAALDQRKQQVMHMRKELEQEKNDANGSLRDAAYRVTMLKMKAQHVPQAPEDAEEMEACQALVKQLKECKVQLDEDWRCKTAAYNIDSFCRNLTPIRAATMFKMPGSPSGASNAGDTLGESMQFSPTGTKDSFLLRNESQKESQ